MMRGVEFKTHERKRVSKLVCGGCAHRGRASGWCYHAREVVKRGDPADDCKHYEVK